MTSNGCSPCPATRLSQFVKPRKLLFSFAPPPPPPPPPLCPSFRPLLPFPPSPSALFPCLEWQTCIPDSNELWDGYLTLPPPSRVSLTPPDAHSYNDYKRSVERLEKHAKSMAGEDRALAMRRWVAVLQELKQPAKAAANPAEPSNAAKVSEPGCAQVFVSASVRGKRANALAWEGGGMAAGVERKRERQQRTQTDGRRGADVGQRHRLIDRDSGSQAQPNTDMAETERANMCAGRTEKSRFKLCTAAATDDSACVGVSLGRGGALLRRCRWGGGRSASSLSSPAADCGCVTCQAAGEEELSAPASSHEDGTDQSLTANAHAVGEGAASPLALSLLPHLSLSLSLSLSLPPPPLSLSLPPSSLISSSASTRSEPCSSPSSRAKHCPKAAVRLRFSSLTRR